MTGRRLYDRYTDARKKCNPYADGTPVAWAYLPWNVQRMWSRMAASLKGERFT